MNRERAIACLGTATCTKRLCHRFTAIHTFLAYGNTNSQLWQVRFTLWQAQFTLSFTLFGREDGTFGEVLTDFAIPTQDFAKPLPLSPSPSLLTQPLSCGLLYAHFLLCLIITNVFV